MRHAAKWGHMLNLLPRLYASANMLALIIIFSLAAPLSANEVFSIGPGAEPDPRLSSASQLSSLNPLSGIDTSSINDKGAWTSGTSYSVNDKVSQNGVSFVACKNHSGASSFAADISSGNWVLFQSTKRSSFNTGRFLSLFSYGSATAWAASTSYNFGDVVSWNGANYIAWQSHWSGSSFASDIGANHWILRSSAPTLSGFTAAQPSGATCTDFDAAFQSGKSSFSGTVDLFAADPGTTGEDVEGSLKLNVTFDWDKEEMSDYSMRVKLDKFPNINTGKLDQTLTKTIWWTPFSFHSNSYNFDNQPRCGRFVLTVSETLNMPANKTIYSSSSLHMKAIISFKKNGGIYVPILQLVSTPPDTNNRVEFYNAIWDDGNIKSYYVTTSGAVMELQ